jgi:DNA polymerase-1
MICHPDIKWIGHNGPHDIRSIDAWLGEPTGVECAGETYIPAHHYDSRKQEDGGVGHSLKDQAIRYVAPDAGKWETELKAVFKTIEVPIPGATYKSGPRKGQPKMRKARLDEGWSLIAADHPAYIKYAGSDPVLAYRLWRHYQPVLRSHLDLYRFDKRVQEAVDRLNRRGMRLDVKYTRQLDNAYVVNAERLKEHAAALGVENINSGAQVATALQALGVELTAKTPTGKYKTDDATLRKVVAKASKDSAAMNLIRAILGAKQMLKRRESYTQSFLREMDSEGRVHPSINSLAARTARMSVSSPPLQQLPTKDREGDE